MLIIFFVLNLTWLFLCILQHVCFKSNMLVNQSLVLFLRVFQFLFQYVLSSNIKLFFQHYIIILFSYTLITYLFTKRRILYKFPYNNRSTAWDSIVVKVEKGNSSWQIKSYAVLLLAIKTWYRIVEQCLYPLFPGKNEWFKVLNLLLMYKFIFNLYLLFQ